MLIWFSQSEYMKYAAFQISNGGVFKHRSENSDSASLEEINNLVHQVKQLQIFIRRGLLILWIKIVRLSLYTANQDGGMYQKIKI